MRKVFIVMSVAVLALGLFSPAEAGHRRSFSISLNPAPAGTQPTYNDTSLDLSSSTAPKNTFTTIRAKVRGGKVAGRKVTIYATNMNSVARERRSLGTAKIARNGYVSKRFAPAKGHAGTYKIEIVKGSGGGYRAKTKTFYIRTFEFVSLARFFDAAASTGRIETVNRETVQSTKWGESYALHGGATAVYTIQGYKCFFFNLKIGLSDTLSYGDGSYTVSQPARGLIMAGAKTQGSTYDEPTKTQGKSVRANEPFVISIAGTERARFVLGNPKISCTYPTNLAPTPF